MQNKIDIQLTDDELTQLDAALTALEGLLARFPVLSAEEKAGLVKAPDGADGWMGNMLTRAEQNLAKLPRDFEPATARRDLALDTTLAPRHLRLNRLADRLEGARFLARSDLFSALLGARRSLREGGVAGVDDNLSDGLQRFFNRSGGDKTPKPAP